MKGLILKKKHTHTQVEEKKLINSSYLTRVKFDSAERGCHLKEDGIRALLAMSVTLEENDPPIFLNCKKKNAQSMIQTVLTSGCLSELTVHPQDTKTPLCGNQSITRR